MGRAEEGKRAQKSPNQPISPRSDAPSPPSSAQRTAWGGNDALPSPRLHFQPPKYKCINKMQLHPKTQCPPPKVRSHPPNGDGVPRMASPRRAVTPVAPPMLQTRPLVCGCTPRFTNASPRLQMHPQIAVTSPKQQLHPQIAVASPRLQLLPPNYTPRRQLHPPVCSCIPQTAEASPK